VPGADLTPPGVAALIAAFLEELDLHDVTIVANDTGGALTQILMTQHPERIARVVLTPSDSFTHFFPLLFRPLTALARVPGSTRLLAKLLGIKVIQRLPIAFGLLSKRPLAPEVMDSFITPARRDPEIRDDLRRFLRGVHRRHTLAAAEQLPKFDRPVLLAWATEDRVFPFKQAVRLAEVLPAATVSGVDDSFTFVPADQPEQLSRMIVEFTRTHATA
jgi:pimeloyl-ACP methyl ester carboxylesterase